MQILVNRADKVHPTLGRQPGNKRDPASRKTNKTPMSMHFLSLFYSLSVTNNSKRATLGYGVRIQSTRAQCGVHEGGKAIWVPILFPLALVSRNNHFQTWASAGKHKMKILLSSQSSLLKKNWKSDSILFWHIPLKICFQWCDNKWLCCSMKSGQQLCKGGKNCFIKMHGGRRNGL